MATWGGVGTPVAGAGAVTPTWSELEEECQLKQDYFPNCATAGAYRAVLTGYITKADKRIKRLVPAQYASSDADVIQEAHDAILYWAASLAWQVILNVMLAYDEESLPPEYVQPAFAADNRDHYASMSGDIVTGFQAEDDSSIASTSQNREREFTQTFRDSEGQVIGNVGSMENW
jgi:hypothetical protein